MMAAEEIVPGTAADMRVHLRPANAADAHAIRRIIRQAGISPFDLDWRRFWIAEAQGQVIGTGQIKPHRDSTRELASIAVVPEWRHQGIASGVIESLLAQEDGVLFLICQSQLETFYRRFGFAIVPPAQYPHSLKRLHRVGNLLINLANTLGVAQNRLTIMRRDPREIE
jgi:N-acetylglutamate synthase-like GNAT family acetyltransferase